jgi:hypothetical protein
VALPTRATLRSNAQIRADQDSADYPSAAAWNIWLDEAAKEVWYDLCAAGWPANFQTTTVTATGARTYSLGVAQVAFVRNVMTFIGGQYYTLYRINEGKRAQLLSLTSTPTGYSEYYDVFVDPAQGYVIELLPVPQGGTYQVDFVPEYAGFGSDAGVWYGPARSDELIELRAAAKGCRKESRLQDAQALDAEYDRLFEKVSAMASWVDQRNPAMIRDEMGRQPRLVGDYPVAGPDTIW